MTVIGSPHWAFRLSRAWTQECCQRVDRMPGGMFQIPASVSARWSRVEQGGSLSQDFRTGITQSRPHRDALETKGNRIGTSEPTQHRLFIPFFSAPLVSWQRQVALLPISAGHIHSATRFRQYRVHLQFLESSAPSFCGRHHFP